MGVVPEPSNPHYLDGKQSPTNSVAEAETGSNRLAYENRHLRDSLLQFNQETHQYAVRNVTLSSVTSVCNELIPFDEEKVAESVVAKHAQNSASPYFGLGVKDVLAKWAAARVRGIEFHKNIEGLLDRLATGNSPVLGGERDEAAIRGDITFDREFEKFLAKHKGRAEEYLIEDVLRDRLCNDRKFDRLYRVEWPIFSLELEWAGRVDAVFETPEDLRAKCPPWRGWVSRHVTIIDWKHIGLATSWEFSEKKRYLQLLMYKLILEISYNVAVDCMISAGASDTGDIRFEVVEQDSAVVHELMELLRPHVGGGLMELVMRPHSAEPAAMHAPAAESVASNCSSTLPALQDWVKIFGLQTEAGRELNGCVGKVIGPYLQDDDHDKVRVRVDVMTHSPREIDVAHVRILGEEERRRTLRTVVRLNQHADVLKGHKPAEEIVYHVSHPTFQRKASCTTSKVFPCGSLAAALGFEDLLIEKLDMRCGDSGGNVPGGGWTMRGNWLAVQLMRACGVQLQGYVETFPEFDTAAPGRGAIGTTGAIGTCVVASPTKSITVDDIALLALFGYQLTGGLQQYLFRKHVASDWDKEESRCDALLKRCITPALAKRLMQESSGTRAEWGKNFAEALGGEPGRSAALWENDKLIAAMEQTGKLGES